jgi:carboxypeptidase Q
MRSFSYTNPAASTPPAARPRALRLALALLLTTTSVALAAAPAAGQDVAVDEEVLERIRVQGMEGSRIYELGQTLMDSIGPRLTGSPGLDAAHDWIVETYGGWGVQAENQPYGTWDRWDEGITHLDLLTPRRTSLTARTLAWTPGTDGPVEGPVVTLPDVTGPAEFQRWLQEDVEGAVVLFTFANPTCRPDEYWERYGTEESVAAMREDRQLRRQEWTRRALASGIDPNLLPVLFEQAGAIAVLTSNWTGSWGTNRVFSGNTSTIPMLDVECEDYGLLARVAENGQSPTVRVSSEASFGDETPTFNTVAWIEGSERPEEYVLLSAHLDTWHGATGATDNGTGTITMMEAMRILAEELPRPRRTIMVGHWGGEEQGLNGSAAFAEDNPHVLAGMQVVMNQDNGTGRIVEIGMQGFTEAGAYFERWLDQVPRELADIIRIDDPGMPDDARSDHASFVCHQVPSFRLGSYEWDYREYTWHSDRDTFDKIAIEEVKGNATLVAMLAYLASEEPELMPRDVRELPGDQDWPACRTPMRTAP